MMDLMQNDQNLRQTLIDVQSEQIIGFYDTDTMELYIISNKSALGVPDKFTIAHEYTHALQDKYFNLSSLPLDSNNSDRAMAARCLIEGDANLAATSYMLSAFNMSDLEEMVNESAGLDTNTLDNAPAIIRADLLFPYESGWDFVQQFNDWQQVNAAYSNPPQSTEQILHPEKYFDSSHLDEPKTVTMPNIQSTLNGTWELKNSDVLGELNIRIYLNTFLSNSSASNAAAGWGGDQLQYWKDNQGKQLLIMYSTWDTVKDADEYFNAYIKFMDTKTGGSWNITTNNTYARQWTTANESVYLSEKGQYALVVIGTDTNAIKKVIAQFPK